MFDPVAFSVFGLKFHWYGMLWVAGFALAYQIFRRFGNRLVARDNDPELATNLMLPLVVSTIVGGRLLYAVVYGQQLLRNDPWWILRIYEGGMSFHGGLLGVALGICWIAYRHKLELLRVADLVALAAPLGMICGRLGNYINGELWGRVTDVPWAQVFPAAGPDPRHPSQLYELASEGVLVFVILYWLVQKPRRPGTLAAVFLVGSALARFGVEYFREADVQLGYFWLGLSAGQLLSIPMLIAGITLLFWLGMRPRVT